MGVNKTVIVSNRLPLQISIDNNQLKVTASVGGLATGMKSVHADGNGLWVGWSGITEDDLDNNLREKVNTKIKEAVLMCSAGTQLVMSGAPPVKTASSGYL